MAKTKKQNFNLIIGAGLFAAITSYGINVQAQNYNQEVIINGLNSPRGITIDSEGNLYIAEAGIGGDSPCIPSPSAQGEELCYGPTGAIAILDPETRNLTRPITNLPSLALPNGSDASGIHDLHFNSNGELLGVLGLAGNPNLRDTVLNIPEFGNLITVDLNPTPSWSPRADLAALERDNNPDGGDLISNPFSLTSLGNTTYAVDAGGNSLLTIDSDNQVEVATIFPTTLVDNSIPDLPNPFPMQPVPTGIAIAPDNSIYVTEYTGFPFPPGEADIYRWQGANLSTIESNFTNLIDLAFDSNGNLYALEYATNVLAGDFTGSLWQITPDGTRNKINVQGLQFPTGLAINENNTIYIANQGFSSGVGEIIALEESDNIVPEAPLILPTALLNVAFWSYILRFRRRFN
jgi:hypothetical protein